MENNQFREEIAQALQMIYDPEIPIDIYNLGLIYDIDIKKNEKEKYDVEITMTLTSVGCPVGPQLMFNVETRVDSLPWTDKVTVSLTFQPAWSPEKISKSGKEKLLALGFDAIFI